MHLKYTYLLLRASTGDQHLAILNWIFHSTLIPPLMLVMLAPVSLTSKINSHQTSTKHLLSHLLLHRFNRKEWYRLKQWSSRILSNSSNKINNKRIIRIVSERIPLNTSTLSSRNPNFHMYSHFSDRTYRHPVPIFLSKALK